MIAAMMVAAISANAQNEVGQFTLKPTVGMNIATLTKTNDSKVRVGLAAGLEAEYGITEKFGLSFGALYSMQGCKWKEGDESLTYKIDYINIPILAQYYVVKGLAIKAGIQPGFCVTKKVKIDGTASVGPGLTEPFTEDVKLGDAVKDFAFAIPVGVSYEYESFVLDARYNIGVTKAAPIPSAVFSFHFSLVRSTSGCFEPLLTFCRAARLCLPSLSALCAEPMRILSRAYRHVVPSLSVQFDSTMVFTSRTLGRQSVPFLPGTWGRFAYPTA